MPEYFYCQCCGKRIRKNPRLKINQLYCGCKSCQRARKNSWEKNRRKNDPVFKELRNRQKNLWRKNLPGHQYQREYRKNNPPYAETNRLKQQIRNEKALKNGSGTLGVNIVKTDALNAVGLIQYGFYEIVPVGTRPGENIVKTDALIVEIRAHSGFQKVLVPETD